MMNDLPAQKAFNLASYLSSFASAIGGLLSVDKVAVVLGMVLAIATYLGNRAHNAYLRRIKDKEHTSAESRAQELHLIEMRLAQAKLEQLNPRQVNRQPDQHEKNSTQSPGCCVAEQAGSVLKPGD
ncbi:hypothetical protein [Shewanella algae]|uniref:hypothetical protein n=3 Tax=Shewanella TaxID=22 RepID=UPI00138DE40B|nr:hypothetical protein [Shewanella algae]QTE80352.1 hypothetical protein E1N14_009805 [Shewanella algae]